VRDSTGGATREDQEFAPRYLGARGQDVGRCVPRLGPKAFEQAAGFLRIRDGEQPLDASAVHPESYPTVDQMARDLTCSVSDLMFDAGRRQKIQLAK
jgi:uncharacterized protein